VLGVAAAGAGASALYFWLNTLSNQDQKDARLSLTPSPQDIATAQSHGMPLPGGSAVYDNCVSGRCKDVCSIARQKDGDPTLAHICDEGEHNATMSTIADVAAGALLVGAGYFFYRGYLASPAPLLDRAAANPRFLLEPQVDFVHGGASLTARIRF
jgi:hypothetical protein